MSSTHEALKSILDNDLYKFSMQNAVLKHYKKSIPVVYQFTNREKELALNPEAIEWLKKQIKGKSFEKSKIRGKSTEMYVLVRYG